MSDKHNSSLKTIDLTLHFTTIDDPKIMEQVVADRNSHHLNQAQETHIHKKQHNI